MPVFQKASFIGALNYIVRSSLIHPAFNALTHICPIAPARPFASVPPVSGIAVAFSVQATSAHRVVFGSALAAASVTIPASPLAFSSGYERRYDLVAVMVWVIHPDCRPYVGWIAKPFEQLGDLPVFIHKLLLVIDIEQAAAAASPENAAALHILANYAFAYLHENSISPVCCKFSHICQGKGIKPVKILGMLTSDFDYNLPPELIAQTPAAVRDECRMLALSRQDGGIQDCIFRDIGSFLSPGDLLVANETRVRPARLIGSKRSTGGAAEVLLLRECVGAEIKTNRVGYWEALVRPGKRLKPGSGAIVDFADDAGRVVMSAEIVDWAQGANAQRGERIVKLSTDLDSLDEALHLAGRAPLPPYIHDYSGDEEMYQTVYSERESSAAAPTAGLHFTPELIQRLKDEGVGWATVELEVGLDTFRIVDEANAEDHEMHTESYTVPVQTVEAIEACKRRGGRVIAVGTTSVRSLESAAALAAESPALLLPTERAATSLFIMPGYSFRVVDAIITNFHVPRSTLMMLVSAFAGRDNIMHAYEHAIEHRYRMLSFGDAMFIH